MQRYVDGLVNQLTDDNETSELNFETALLMDSSADIVRVSLAESYLISGRYDQAMTEIQTVLRHHPGHQDALEVESEIHIRQHNFDKAIATLEKIAKLYPGNIDAHYRLITIYEIQGKLNEAANHYVSLLDIVGPNSLLSMKLGDLYMRNRSYEKAVDVFSRAKGSDPNNSEILNGLAQAYRLNKNIPKALETYESLAQIEENNTQIHALLGQLSIQSGNFDRAVSAFKRADQLSPNTYEFQRAIGFSLSQLKRNAEAVEYLERAVSLNPKDVLSLTLLAPIYQDLKRDEKADTAFEKILTIEPENEVILNNYSYHLAVRGLRLEKAKTLIEKALKKAPQNAHFLDTMGWVLYRMGYYGQALDYVRRSYAQNSTSEEVCDHLGDIYWKLNQSGEAKRFWEQALKLNPENETVKKKIGQVRE